MKKRIVVTVTKEIDIEINDKHLTEEALAEFSSFMFPVGTPDGLFKYAARCCFDDTCTFIVGIGPAESKYSSVPAEVVFYIDNEETDSEILGTE